MYITASKNQAEKTEREEISRITLAMLTDSFGIIVDESTERVEKNTGYAFSYSEKMNILAYAIQKIEYIQKTIEYLPVLFENELYDYVMRKVITAV